MSNLNERGLPGLHLDPLLKTLSLKKMSDEKMVNYLRSNLLDSSSPNPSIETLLHAYLPFKYVDHTHSNAILSLVNLDNSKEILYKIYKDKIAIVPYVMPGFELAKLCHIVISKNHKVEGLMLLNHGIFTFGSSAKQSYDRMINIVEDLEDDALADVLAALSAEDRVLIEEALSFPEDSAGRLMQREIIAVPSFWTVCVPLFLSLHRLALMSWCFSCF